MDPKKFTMAEITSYDDARLKDTESELRKELALKRMNVFTSQGKADGQAKNLRKVLARVETVKSQRRIKKS